MQNHFANFAKPFCPLHVERGLRNISIINLDKISHSFGMSLKEFFDPVPKNLNHNP